MICRIYCIFTSLFFLIYASPMLFIWNFFLSSKIITILNQNYFFHLRLLPYQISKTELFHSFKIITVFYERFSSHWRLSQDIVCRILLDWGCHETSERSFHKRERFARSSRKILVNHCSLSIHWAKSHWIWVHQWTHRSFSLCQPWRCFASRVIKQ